MYDNETIKEESWWKRNWKWVVPVGGCLSVIIIGIVLVASLVFGVKNAISDSDYRSLVIEEVRENPTAIEFLGTPIEDNGISNYNFQWKNGETFVNFEMDVSGPKGSGNVIVKGTSEDDVKVFNELRLIIDDSDIEVNLLK